MHRNLNKAERVLRSLVIAPPAVVAALLVGVGSFLGLALVLVAVLMVATSAVLAPLGALASHSRRAAAAARPTDLKEKTWM
jgi:hypothetical protein